MSPRNTRPELRIYRETARARNDLYQQIVDTSFLTWIADDEWPGTRFLAKQYLKSPKGE